MSALDLALDLADRLKLDKRRDRWAGDCPACGYARAFAMKLPRQGDRPWLWCANGCNREQLADAAGKSLGTDWTPPPPPDPIGDAASREDRQRRALALFAGAARITSADPAGLYLNRRGLAHLLGCPALRYRADCHHPQSGRCSAMVAEVKNGSGKPIAVHRTYLAHDGQKAAVDPVKASLGPVWGGAIRLHPVADELAIGEGIETAASAGLLLGLPAWAAISAGNLAQGLVLPPEVRAVVIAVDPDTAGRSAAADAAARWRAEGRRVRLATPDRAGEDFNDLLTEPARAVCEVSHG